MNLLKSTRIESIDLLRGTVMILMALDHARDYFHFGAGLTDPTDLETTTPVLFFTRFVTHFCAPVFVFLAGTSAYLYGSKKSKKDLSKFLFTRGVWLIFVEVFINGFIWWFDISYGFINLQVLWAIGISMISLSLLIHLPFKLLIAVGIAIVAGHNLLDGIVMEGYSWQAISWYILHQQQFLPISQTRFILFNYPVLAWIGVMTLGYCFGTLYKSGFEVAERKKWLLRLGGGAIVLFLILRGINVYGNLHPWAVQKNAVFTFLSFINVTKYPPSLAFVLITLGFGLLFLYATENIKNRFTRFVLVYGRVPFFYYLLHMLFIHLAALLLLVVLGKDWHIMIFTTDVFTSGALQTYGYPLWVTYIVWIVVVLSLYPLCNWYMKYKANNKDKWWLSYL